jgi:hypothetical protein
MMQVAKAYFTSTPLHQKIRVAFVESSSSSELYPKSDGITKRVVTYFKVQYLRPILRLLDLDPLKLIGFFFWYDESTFRFNEPSV